MRGVLDNRIARIALAAVITLVVAQCNDGPLYPEDMAVFEVQVPGGERFRIGLSSEAQIAQAAALLASGAENNVHGTVRRGSGRNAPYSWHLDPASITFPDLTMEICDGRPQSDVESDVGYWIDTVKYYCPWGAKVVARVN